MYEGPVGSSFLAQYANMENSSQQASATDAPTPRILYPDLLK